MLLHSVQLPQNPAFGENTTFQGDEHLFRARGLSLDVGQDARCLELTRRFIAEPPDVRDEDIGSYARRSGGLENWHHASAQ